MRIGMVDVDNPIRTEKTFPNLALMKLSSWHKQNGDTVEWYDPLFSGHMDRVYMSKVFSFSKDVPDWLIDADEIVKGGSGYHIQIDENGKEKFCGADTNLPDEVEHIMPDYSLYGITDTAYGFMSRGCPRGCHFCIVANKEGKRSHKVADLSEFWSGQKKIEIMDPNTLACPDWKDILTQLRDSKAKVNINQGCDIRLMTEEKADLIRQIRMSHIHFAYDNPKDREIIEPRLKQFSEVTGWKRSKVSVYCLVNFNSTMEENLERIHYIRSLDFNPYVMIYEKYRLPKHHELRRLQRWVNNKIIFWSCPTFEEYNIRY